MPILIPVFFIILITIVFLKAVIIVPHQSAYITERLGKYSRKLEAGWHILFPFLEIVKYKHSLKEIAVDIPEQICITSDNVQVGVDGILYLKVISPERASYGVENYKFAVTQLAQITLRSEIGKIERDRVFQEREHINAQVFTKLDSASQAWGIKVERYEIINIKPSI